MTVSETLVASIDDHLGPSAGRYFGDGFTRVDQQLTNVEVTRLGLCGEVRADAHIAFTGDWSRKSAGAQRPHLSSIDALVLSVRLAEIYLAHTYALDPARRRRMWLRRFDMKAPGAPTEDVARFGACAVHRGCTAAPASRCGHASTFSCTIGTIGVMIEIEHEVVSPGTGDGIFALEPDYLGPTEERYFGDGYRTRAQLIHGVRPAPDGRSVEAAVDVVARAGDASLTQGLGGAYEPSLSMIDSLLTLAQLAQVLAYSFDRIDRSDSNTLWMRRLSMTSTTPRRPLAGSLAATVWLERERLLELDGGHWRALEMTGNVCGISARSSIAHRLPAGATALA